MLSFRQSSEDGDGLEHAVSEVIAQGRTDYQSYRFLRTPTHGVCVALDGDIQSCETDEAIYHEALVHPAMLFHPAPRRVLIMGGGEGATAREVLRHPGVEHVIMVDLDAEFVSLCREHLAGWNAPAYADPRLEVQCRDINAYLDEDGPGFDVVIGDLVDFSGEDDPAAGLYSGAFYARLRPRLNAGALVGTQAGGVTASHAEGARRVCRTLADSFAHVSAYAVIVPSFYHLWSFALACDAPLPRPGEPPLETLATRAEARGLKLPGTGAISLAAAFALPQAIHERIFPEWQAES